MKILMVALIAMAILTGCWDDLKPADPTVVDKVQSIADSGDEPGEESTEASSDDATSDDGESSQPDDNPANTPDDGDSGDDADPE